MNTEGSEEKSGAEKNLREEASTCALESKSDRCCDAGLVLIPQPLLCPACHMKPSLHTLKSGCLIGMQMRWRSLSRGRSLAAGSMRVRLPLRVRVVWQRSLS